MFVLEASLPNLSIQISPIWQNDISDSSPVAALAFHFYFEMLSRSVQKSRQEEARVPVSVLVSVGAERFVPFRGSIYPYPGRFVVNLPGFGCVWVADLRLKCAVLRNRAQAMS